ncbi:hypothetical protein COT44_03625 [Candidatus Shapirobacteria bacterium CG08_land_8_20_14_0_20_39_18]|uniref:Peptidase C-terminal archaeal/bacterial domain-containing protein n=1 Tax=Candidatus Shapirobacteria bacterium CG08_land_8_20_14_0_20_39_18 TaxID=1974883 RepID=A0A2M6XCX7_9BACT|nr:MAG: hypothetical protein COT44_03625 [Candidatus Shapirobacteria bacterium CG08_land_8_20_14_0_20_39_18]PJE68004.1 MAG: hypothetical protein COU94_04170 [Candidatus Shapirobacteria bacterium CG10_big_fil_rev_8_21_14_0_10_38_8]
MKNQINIGDQNNIGLNQANQTANNIELEPKAAENEVVSNTPKQTNFKRHYIWAVAILAVLLVSGSFGFYFYKTSVSTKLGTSQTTETEPTIPLEAVPTTIKEPAQQVTSKPNVSLETGFSFHLPTDWSAKISNQSKQHFYGKFFIPNVSAENSFVEIESISSSRLIKNPFVTAEKTEQKKINNLSVVITEGKENFQKSNRLVKQATFTNKGNSLVVTLYRKSTEQITNQFESLIQSVSSSDQKLSRGFTIIDYVYAAESIAGIDKNQYTKIEVMGDPLPERITKNDTPYKDGYGKFYTFEAFKGQRLTTVAMEDRTTNPGGFIRSELYDEQGQMLDQKDTRIEFTAPYTGVYYYIVRSFNNQEGGYLLKVFDRNQTENLVYVKYDDGSERLVDPNMSPPVYGERDVAIIIQFVNPIEVIDNQTVRYFAKPLEFESGLGLINTPVKTYVKKETYSEFLNTPGNELPENNGSYLIKTVITKLSPSKIILQQEGGTLLPKGNHISMTEQKKGITRFFLENPAQ